ncbi:MAG: HAD family hydrolase [Rhodospirillales bacterium]|nr:MAG: HAD family hydrolase [Rhodospirillales bacterium]
MRACVFLDRDGVLNRNVLRDGRQNAPRRLEDYRLLPGVQKAVERLKQAGFAIVVVTNQPDIGNRAVDPAIANAMNERLRSKINPDAIEMCPHTRADGCTCRKPKPGMLLTAAKRLGIDLERSFMVGDRFTDIGAGQAAGCFSILLGDGYGEAAVATPDARAANLPKAVDLILNMQAKPK